MVEADLELHPILFCRRDHPFCLCGVPAERFLTQDVFSPVGSLYNDRRQSVVCSGYDYCLNFFGERAVPAVSGLTSVIICQLRCPAHVAVNDTYQLASRIFGEHSRPFSTDQAATDDRYTNRLILR
jgi:hypothetical protein